MITCIIQSSTKLPLFQTSFSIDRNIRQFSLRIIGDFTNRRFPDCSTLNISGRSRVHTANIPLLSKRFYSNFRKNDNIRDIEEMKKKERILIEKFSTEHLHFKEADLKQVDLLKDWLSKDHIKKYWGDGGLTLPDYEKFTTGRPSIFKHYFGYYFEAPIVFFMTSEAEKGGDWDKWREESGLNLTLDMMIGDKTFVGKGVAHVILEEFCEEMCSEAVAVLVDPEATHKKAIRVYEKAGFTPQGIYLPKEGNWAGIEHLIMRKLL